MRDRESIIFACLDGPAGPHTTCMFDMCSMAVDCRKTATVSDGWAAVHCKVASRRVPRFDEGGRKFWVLSQTALFFFFVRRSSFLPSSFLPIISSLVKKCNYFSSKVFSNERSPTRRTDGRTARQTGQAARARRPHTQGGSDADGRRQQIKATRARAGPVSAKVKEEGGIINILVVCRSWSLLAEEEFVIPSCLFSVSCRPFLVAVFKSLVLLVLVLDLTVQGSAKRWALGCMNPASLLPLATGSEFTQPRGRAHLLADPCTVLFAHLSPEIRISTLGLFVHTLRHTELCTGL